MRAFLTDPDLDPEAALAAIQAVEDQIDRVQAAARRHKRAFSRVTDEQDRADATDDAKGSVEGLLLRAGRADTYFDQMMLTLRQIRNKRDSFLARLGIDPAGE